MVVAEAAGVVAMIMAASLMPGTGFLLGVTCFRGLPWLDTTVLAILRKHI